MASWKGQDVYSAVSGAVSQSGDPLAAAGSSDAPELLRMTCSLQCTAPVPTYEVRTSSHQSNQAPSVSRECYSVFESVSGLTDS